MATKSPILILAVLGAAAFFLFSGKRAQRFDPPVGGATAQPQPITSTRPTVPFGADPPGGGISFGSRPPLPIPPVPPLTDDDPPFIGPILPPVTDPGRPPVSPPSGFPARPPVSLPITGPISPGVPAFGPQPIPDLFVAPEETPVLSPTRPLPITGPISPGVPAFGPQPIPDLFVAPIIDIEIRPGATGIPSQGPEPFGPGVNRLEPVRVEGPSIGGVFTLFPGADRIQ